MVVKFTQVGTNLILENKESLVQFSKNTPVKVKLSDNVFTKNSGITINQSPNNKLPIPSIGKRGAASPSGLFRPK